MNNTPKLRFKEFDGKWEKKNLDKIVERITRKNKGIVSKLPLTISAQYGLVDQETFFNKTVASKNLEGYYLLENGEFAYNKSYSSGYPWGAIKRLEIYDKGVLSSLYICFRVLNKVNSDYIKQYFETNKWHKEVSVIAVEGARNHGLLNISVSDFFNTLHYIPSLSEQEKIASFLSLFDEKIELQEKKIASLEKYKKGMMQKIFSQELRFKDENGENYPEWEEKKLGDIGTFSSGGSLSKKDLSENGYKCILYGDLFTEYTEIINDVCHHTNKKEKLIYGEYNTLLFPTSTTVDAISLICPSALMIKDKVVLGGDISIFKPGVDNIICSFLSYQINGILKNQFSKKAQGSTIIHIYSSDLKTCKVLLPCIEEQEKIVDFLSTIDSKVELEQKKLDKLKEYKKGLLQQMFV